MLPREADPAENLDAVLGAGEEGLRRQRSRHRRGQRGLLPVVGAARRVPGHGGGLTGGDEHVGAAVLDGLELPDGPAELLADLGVRRGGVDAPVGPPGALGRHHDGGEVRHEPTVEVRQAALGSHGRTVDDDLTDPPGRVEAGQRLDRHVAAVQRVPAVTVRTGRRDHDQPGLGGAEHGSGTARQAHGAVAGGLGDDGGGTERDRTRGRAVAQPGEQGPPQRFSPAGGDGRAGQHGGQEGTGRHGPPQLLEHHGQLRQAEPLTPVGLADVQAEPTLFDQRRPECRQLLAVRVEEGAGHRRRAVGLGPAPHRVVERGVLLAHPYGHKSSSPSIR